MCFGSLGHSSENILCGVQLSLIPVGERYMTLLNLFFFNHNQKLPGLNVLCASTFYFEMFSAIIACFCN